MMMKEILIDVDDWALCKHTSDNNLNDTTVYAEHITGCSDVSYSDSSSWCWEYDDGMGGDGYEACWKCMVRVPKEIVGLVLLYNWGKPGRHDG